MGLQARGFMPPEVGIAGPRGGRAGYTAGKLLSFAAMGWGGSRCRGRYAQLIALYDGSTNKSNILFLYLL